MKKHVGIMVILCLVFSVLSPFRTIERVSATSIPIYIGFEPYDFVVDPTKPIAYLTKVGSKNVYAVNYETQEIQTLSLPYPAEKIEIYNGNLYATQQKETHDPYNSGAQNGGIAVIDLEAFTLSTVISVETDPYDIAIDENGYIYITSGSGQWTYIQSYSLETKKFIDKKSIDHLSTAYYNQETSRIYTIDSTSFPRDMKAYQVENGRFVDSYDSPYHGHYDLKTTAAISPDGTKLYNMSGNVFDLTKERVSDLTYHFSLPDTYVDMAFSSDNTFTFAANELGGVDVFKLDSDAYYYSLKEDVLVLNLAFKDGLVMVYQDDTERYYLEYVSDYGPLAFGMNEAAYFNDDEVDSLENNMKNVPKDSAFLFKYTHNFDLMDYKKIHLNDLSGKEVPLDFEVDDEFLVIIPRNELNESAFYKITLDKGALRSIYTKELSELVSYNFKTKQPAITDVQVSIDRKKAPLEYTFLAKVTGGELPQYKFSIKENDGWKVLRNYTGQSSYVWKPTKSGEYTFKVSVRNSDSVAEYEKEKIFYQTIDVAPPNLILVPDTTLPTNKDVKITAYASSLAGIKKIVLPNGTAITDATAIFMAKENGEFVFKAYDYLGNISTQTVKVSNIDKIKPTIRLETDINEPTDKSVTILAHIQDEKSGVESVMLPNGAYVNGSLLTYRVDKNGTYTFEVTDKAGNVAIQSIKVSNIYKNLNVREDVVTDMKKFDGGTSHLTYINGRGYSQFFYENRSGNYQFIPSSWLKAAGLTVELKNISGKKLLYITNPYKTTKSIVRQEELVVMPKVVVRITDVKDLKKYDAGIGGYLTYINNTPYSQYFYENTRGTYQFVPSSWLKAAGLTVELKTVGGVKKLYISNPYKK